MRGIIICFLLIQATHGLRFKTASQIEDSLDGGYRPEETVDVDDAWFKRFYKNSIPVTEISMMDANNLQFPVELPFVVKNSYEWNPFDEDSECYDMFGHMMYKSSNKSLVSNLISKTYHTFQTVYRDAEETGASSCVPFIGKKNHINLGYWNSMNESYLTPMHADDSTNTIWCKSGVKYVFLWNPDDHDNLYIKHWDDRASGYLRRSPYRVENIDMKQYPKYWRAKRYVVKMEAHDILHMPYKWIHHVYTMPGSMCINYWHRHDIYDVPFQREPSETVTLSLNFDHVHHRRLTKKNKTLLNQLWWMDDVIALRLALGNGQLIKIPNAFPNHEELQLRYDDDWENQLSEKRNGNQTWYDRDMCKNCAKRFKDEIKKYGKFWETLLGTKLENPEQFRGTRYSKGQYLDNHDDDTHDRVLSMVYHMSGDWNPECGGEFVWNGGVGSKKILPSYNTLYLFIPRPDSDHRIKKVHCGHRVGYSGWLQSKKPSVDFVTMVHTYRWNQENRPGDVWDVTSGVDGPKSKPSTLEEVKEWYE